MQTENAVNTMGNLQPKGFPGLPPDWTTEVETISGFDAGGGGVKLFLAHHHRQAWNGSEALLVIHGQGEHFGRYLHFPHFLDARLGETLGSIHGFDLRGHGRSGGGRGHVEDFDHYVADAAIVARLLVERLEKKFGQVRLHLLGHSMGGLTALRLLMFNPDLPIKSATISSPLLGLKVKVPLPKLVAAKVLAKVWGSIQMPTGLDVTKIGHDPCVQEAYAKDRLVHDKATPRFFMQMQAALRDMFAGEKEIRVPIQFLVSMDDEIVDPNATIDFFQKLKAKTKELKTYPGFRHEPFNEGAGVTGAKVPEGVDKARAFDDLAGWIRRYS
ncbi:MAG: alpha/beta fold hydrolase [Bacteriovoracia bacterium]